MTSTTTEGACELRADASTAVRSPGEQTGGTEPSGDLVDPPLGRFDTMTASPSDTPTVMKSLLYRPLWLSATALAVLLVLALGLLMFTSWRELRRLEPVHAHLAELSRLEQAALLAQQILMDSLDQGSVKPADLARLRSSIQDIAALDSHLVPETPRRLARMDAVLADVGLAPRKALGETLGLIRDSLAAETRAHDRLLTQVSADTLAEFQIATYSVIVFPLLAVLLVFSLRNRILLPLRTLQSFMALLGRQAYSLAPTRGVDPTVRPLFENYNQLVGRLQELQHEHETRERSLQDEVRTATRTVLNQQRELARAERLAATGEIAAGVAHELRNPLAGIQMALHNLRQELTDADQAERVDLVVAELKRLIRLLNDLLAQARQPPELSTRLDLGQVVTELLALARYQVPAQIRLEHRIPQGMHCELPEGALRQALLNLILNAAQALKEESGTVSLSADRSDDLLTIAVTDDGPGFPPQLLQGGARLFATWREQGTGLGLAMVQRFARDLAGELRLVNLEPRGASATLRLPCRNYP